MKVCTNSKCKHGYTPQPNSNFAKRGKKKKNGEEMYLSHCKACTSTAQANRVSKKREIIKTAKEVNKNKSRKEMFECEDCGAKVTRYSSRCRDCATLYTQKEPSVDKYKGTINPRFLVRGDISQSNRDCNISVEA